MANIEEFLKKIPGSKSELHDVDCYIDNTGDFRRLENVDVLIKSIINLLLTARGTYIFDPDFGCDLYKYVYEPTDEITQQDIYMEIERAISRYETRGDISYDVLFFKNKKGFRVNVSVGYKGKRKTVSINIDETLLTTIEK